MKPGSVVSTWLSTCPTDATPSEFATKTARNEDRSAMRTVPWRAARGQRAGHQLTERPGVLEMRDRTLVPHSGQPLRGGRRFTGRADHDHDGRAFSVPRLEYAHPYRRVQQAGTESVPDVRAPGRRPGWSRVAESSRDRCNPRPRTAPPRPAPDLHSGEVAEVHDRRICELISGRGPAVDLNARNVHKRDSTLAVHRQYRDKQRRRHLVADDRSDHRTRPGQPRNAGPDC